MRSLSVLAVLILLAGCGFQPMYAHGRTDVQMGSVNVLPLPERMGQELRNALLDRGFGNSDSAGGTTLKLESLVESRTDLGIAPDSTATRRQLTLTAVLVLEKDGREILRRPLTTRTSYNVLISQYTTIVSEDSARRQAIEDLARQIETQTVLALDSPQ